MAFLKNMYQKLLGEEIDEESDAETADASDEGVNEEAASNMADEKKGKAPAQNARQQETSHAATLKKRHPLSPIPSHRSGSKIAPFRG